MKQYFGGLILTLFLFSSCAAGVQESIDSAQFALDRGDYAAAVTNANKALTADSTNVEAALLLSTAYAGKAGIELTKIADDLVNTVGTGGKNDDFGVIRTAFQSLLDESSDLDNIRNGIVALTTTLTKPPTSTTDRFYKAYYFQLGFLRTLEAFILPTMIAAPSGNANNNYTPGNITTTHWTNVLNDFLNADDDLDKAGQGTGDLIKTLRQNYCAMKAATSGDTAGQGFTLLQLRDLMRCQLDDNTTTPKTAFETIGTCAEFTFTTCSGVGDTTN